MMRRLLIVAGVAFALSVFSVMLPGAAAAEVGRVIVKYKNESAIQGLPDSSARMRSMSAQTGLKVIASRAMIGRMHAVRAEGVTSQELATRLAERSDVEYAVPDKRKFIRAIPTDPLYVRQWYLQSTEVSAINAQGAWDTTTGSSDVVVAVLDTGVVANHPDLTDRLTSSGGTLYGHDFVSDVAAANDGDGSDDDPSDPGDWLTAQEAASGDFMGCSPGSSSWHGTMMAGIIAASSNNAIGVAGVSWGARILPVRVLGKCGGYDSDILSGMLWAAGLPVSGVSTNIYPAKIVNMSLGSADSCNAAYQDVIDQMGAAGSIVVAASGNDSALVGTPGNCSGALAVTAIRHAGTKVGYSSYGVAAGIAAPGGNCGDSGDCQYPFYTTLNSGTTVPGSNTYSSARDEEIGTSFSTPLVAGVAALMRSVNSSLTPDRLISRLKSSATAFPDVSGIPSCTSPIAETGIECNCTTTTCGAGMLNAVNAVNEALRPVAVISSVTTATAGSSISLGSAQSTAADGHHIAGYRWTSNTGTLSNASQANATLVASRGGTVTVTLRVTDDAGKADTATTSIVVSVEVPGAPAIGTATAGNTQATVSFTPPAFTGGMPVTGYTVTSNPGGTTATGTSSPITVTGLTNGTAYTFTVTASNAIGRGPASSASNSVTPTAVQVITFANPGPQTFGTSPRLSATSDFGLTVTFTSATPDICTITTDGVLNFVTTGTCSINADQNGNSSSSAAARVQQSFTVNKANQTITFGPLQSITLGDADMDPAASVSSGLPLTYSSSNQSVATIINGKIHPVGVGVSVITVSQVGNANYLAASDAQTVTVAYLPAPPQLAVSALSSNAVTTGSTQNISGMITDPNGIKLLTVNGMSATVNNDGSFSFPVQLVAGTNTIPIVVTSNADLVSSETRTVILESTLPRIVVDFPSDNAITSKENITISGTIFPGARSSSPPDPAMAVTCSVNGAAPQTAIMNSSDYSCTTRLVPGMNTVNLFASNGAGQTVETKRTITFKPAFSLAVTDPAADIRLVAGSYLLQGSVTDTVTPVSVIITMDNLMFTPEVTDGGFKQSLAFSEDRVYQAFITSVDRNDTRQTVQRNFVKIGPTANSRGFTIADALQALMIAAGNQTPDIVQSLRLDLAPMVNGVSEGDGKVDIEDAIVLLRMAVGLILSD